MRFAWLRWRILLALTVMLAFGVVRLPLESAQEQKWRALELRAGKISLGVREQLGQMSFVAALGGFRSLLASFLSLEAHIAWEHVDWGKLESTYELITTLQPRVVGYWDEYGWHLGYNASAFYRDNEELRAAMRVYLEKQYVEKGAAVLRKGIANNPDDYLLYVRLGEMRRSKKEDHCAAAEAFEEAAAREGAPAYASRFAAYELAECAGREVEAYERLRELFHEGKRHHVPTLLAMIRMLEEKLEIPAAERVQMEPGQRE